MNLQEIRKIAKQFDIAAGKLKKDELIRSIQIQEGNFDCFSTAASGYCDQFGCLWREDCLKDSTSAMKQEAEPVKAAVPATSKTPAKTGSKSKSAAISKAKSKGGSATLN